MTNGSCLTEEVIVRLTRLRPLFVSVSFNGATPELRDRDMHDSRAEGGEVALASPALLRRYDIPFLGSYVPWPSRPLEDMAEFLRLMDRYDAAAARIFLPSWTQFTRQEPPFDTWEFWAQAVEVGRGEGPPRGGRWWRGRPGAVHWERDPGRWSRKPHRSPDLGLTEAVTSNPGGVRRHVGLGRRGHPGSASACLHALRRGG